MRITLAGKTVGKLSQLAYTLAEVAVTSALLAILFVSLYGGMSSGFAITQSSRENLRATQILLERMEGIRLYNWNQLNYSNWVPAVFTNYYYPMTNAGESPGIMYIGRMSIEPNPTMTPSASYRSSMCAVRASVNWVSGGVPRTRTMTTYVALNGIQNYIYNNTNFILSDLSNPFILP